MLQHLIIHPSLHYVSCGRLQEVKSKGKFPTFSSKSGCGCGCLGEGPFTRGTKCTDLA